MNSKLAVDATNISQDAIHKPASEQFQRDGKPVFWCDSCESYIPRHTCEWKVLVAIVLAAALACARYAGSVFRAVVSP